MDVTSVTCPSCFEGFEVVMPPESECPCVVDYDCEVCCRPMIIEYTDGAAFASSLDD